MKNKDLIRIKSPSNIHNLKEIDLSFYFLKFWQSFNITTVIIKILTNRGNLIKIFDFQNLSSFILHNLRSSRYQKKNFIPLKCLLFITIPIFLYRINSRSLLERDNLVLTRLVNTAVRNSGVIQGMSRESDDMDLFYLPTRLRTLPVCDTTNLTNLEWWKDWIIKDILPSWKIPQRLINEVEMALREKTVLNLRNFFELYTYSFYNQYSDAWKYDFDYYFLRKQNDRMDCNLEQQIPSFPNNNLFSSVMIAFCEKILFEAEDSSNKQEYKSNLQFIHSHLWMYPNQYHYMNLSHHLVVNYIEYLKDFRVRDRFWNLFEDFVEFYSWAYYSANLSTWQRYEDKLGILKDIVKQRLISFNIVSSSEKNTIAIQSLFSEILSHFSIYLLSKVKTSRRLKGSRIEKMGTTDLKMPKSNLFKNFGIITKDEDTKVFVSESSIFNGIQYPYWNLNYSKYYLLNKWNWKKLVVPVESEINIGYPNMGDKFSDIHESIEEKCIEDESIEEKCIEDESIENESIEDESIEDEKAYEAIGETAKSFIETLSPSSRENRILVNKNSNLISLSILKPFHFNLWKMLPMHEHPLSVKSVSEKRQLLEKQQSIFLIDSKFSDILKIVDIWGRSRYCHYPSSRYSKLVGDSLFLRKRIGRAKEMEWGCYV